MACPLVWAATVTGVPVFSAVDGLPRSGAPAAEVSVVVKGAHRAEFDLVPDFVKPKKVENSFLQTNIRLNCFNYG